MHALHLRSLTLDRFFSHTHTHIEFPRVGVVLFTGANGAGKSALIDAVNVAFWGETLRGRAAWSPAGGEVSATSGTLSATRRNHRTRTTLAWHPVGEPPTVWESTAKAQEALQDVIGLSALWQRVHVFGRKVAAEFADDSDGGRKRTLEELLGLDGMDLALARCREELRANDRAHLAAVQQEEAAARRVRDLEGRCARNAAVAHPTEPTPGALAAAQAAEAELTTRHGPALSAPVALRHTVEAWRADVRRRESDIARTSTARACPTCKRPLESASTDVHTVREHMEHDLATAKQALSEAETALHEAQEAADAAAEALRAAQGTTRACAAAEWAWRAFEEVRANAERDLADLAAAQKELAQTIERRRAAGHAYAVSKATEGVLGLQGVRGHVLAHALPVLSDNASRWLAKLGRPAWRIELTTTTTNKSGTVADKIAVVLHGTPHPDGYKSLSSGEQKRVDLALLLGLGDLANAAQRCPIGTRFFDEALDPPLDEQGAADVAAVLRELAYGPTGAPDDAHPGSCIVVIAHSPAVARVLRPDVHYAVDAGVVTRLK